jgi:uncharacterized protein (TIGR00369 family)
MAGVKSAGASRYFIEMMMSGNRETSRSPSLMVARRISQGSRERIPMQSGSAGKTYGTVSAEKQKQMSGLEFVQGLADGTLPLNTLAQTLGYDVTEAASGRVVITAQPSGIHLNPAGTVHGGLAATLLDSCMGLAVQSTLEKGVGQTTLEFKISLVRPITPETGEIRAEGVVLTRGRRVGTAEGRITDRTGRLLAHGTTTCLILES